MQSYHLCGRRDHLRGRRDAAEMIFSAAEMISAAAETISAAAQIISAAAEMNCALIYNPLLINTLIGWLFLVTEGFALDGVNIDQDLRFNLQPFINQHQRLAPVAENTHPF